jgi:type I restriction enzyme S subunit
MASKNWHKIPLKKLCSRIGDGIHGTPNYVDNGDVYFINGNNLKNGRIEITKDTKTVTEAELKNSFIPLNENSLLLSINGTLGSMAFFNNEKVMLGKSAAYLNFNSNINRFYYYYFQLKGIQNYFYDVATGSTIKNLSLKSIQDFEVPIPEEFEWKGIVKTLSSIDTKIELNNRINRELEAMAKTLYDYWFVQFDFPNEQGKPYKSSGGKMVYNSELKREIPEGWENGTLGDISDLVRGVTYDASDIKEENDYDVIPILRATNISGNVIDLDNMVFVPKQNVSANQVLNKFDILITMSSGSKDHIGKNGFFYFDKEVAFGAFCAKIVAKDKYRFYVYSYTQSDFMFSTIKNECLGTNINNLNGSLVKGFKIVIPPVDLVEKFNNEVLSIYEMIGNNHKQNQRLSELRDWLLPMLMNGQVTVNEAEEKLSMAAEPSGEYKKG